MVTVSHNLQQYTQLVEGKHIFPCHSTVLRDLAPGDSHPSYTTVYITDGGPRLYRVV